MSQSLGPTRKCSTEGMARQPWWLSSGMLWPVLVILNCLWVQNVQSLCSIEESQALLALKGEGNQSSALSSWKEGSDCCSEWAGVTCDASATHVMALNLTGPLRLVNGDISESLCNLSELQVLNISIVSLVGSGELSACIWNMTELRYFAIRSDAVEYVRGSLPQQICNLKHLTHLDIDGVDSDGLAPDCLWEMTKLEHLELGFKSVSGSFSTGVCNLKNLKHLGARGDTFYQAYVPDCIWRISTFQHIRLYFFPLPSSITVDVCNLKNLQTLVMALTRLRGKLPPCIWNLTNMEYLEVENLGNLPVQVSIPSDICNLKNLAPVSVSDVAEHGLLSISPTCLGMLRLDNIFRTSHPSLKVSLSPQMCNLSKLRVLRIQFNDFSGVLPACIWNMARLEVLDLSGLDLSNMEVPTEVFVPSLKMLLLESTKVRRGLLDALPNMSALTYLGLFGNDITFLSDEFQRLSELSYLDLSGNALEEIPLLSNGTKLEELYLSGNRIKSFPLGMFNLSNLIMLDLSSNPLETLSGLCQLQQLEHLFLSNTSITSLDETNSLLCLKNLQYLDLSSNNISSDLTTVISSTVFNWTHLSTLNLSRTNISGTVPEIYGGHRLNLDLSWNSLEGPLPRFSSSTFQALVLSGNNFTGALPSGLEKSLDLEILDVSFNSLSGNIPAYLGNFKGLTILDLTSNRFSGSLPEALENCTSLQHLRVKSNSIQGEIPRSIGRIGLQLLSLTLSNNDLIGPIPSTLGSCTHLELLDLSHNSLNGTLPSTLGNLFRSLRVFSMASNRLTGPFPAWIVSHNFTYLQVLDLSDNLFHGYLPAAYSQLSGFINGTHNNEESVLYTDGVTISVKGASSLTFTYFLAATTSFDVSSNKFSGNIPEKLGDLHALRYLKLSNNGFSGMIPTQLSKLDELESLDLSQNSLTGSIPSELDDIPQLASFNVSYNVLTGAVPEGPQFLTFNESSFQNNSGLCAVSGFPFLSRCLNSPAGSLTNSSQVSHPDSWRQKISQWISLDAFLVGFGPSFAVVLFTLLLSSAWDLLFVPRRETRRIYQCTEPYGLYIPRE